MSILVHFRGNGDTVDFRYEDRIYSKIFVYSEAGHMAAEKPRMKNAGLLK